MFWPWRKFTFGWGFRFWTFSSIKTFFFGRGEGRGLPSPRLVTLVVRLVHVVEEHLEASTEGNIVPSESEYVPVQAAAVGSGKKCLKY